jgi:hypothetical protein
MQRGISHDTPFSFRTYLVEGTSVTKELWSMFIIAMMGNVEEQGRPTAHRTMIKAGEGVGLVFHLADKITR